MRGRGSPRRVPRKVRMSSVLRVVREPPERAVPKPRPEGMRYLRSDATPNWSQRVSKRTGEVELIASKPPVTIASASSILEASEIMTEKWVRGLIVTDSRGVLQGLLTATDLVNYLGGGEYYNIVVNKHNRNIYRALERESVSSIMNRAPEFVKRDESLVSVLDLMVRTGFGILPLVNEERRVIGVVTEHDIVKSLYEKKVGKKVREYTTTTIVSVDKDRELKVAGVLMTKHRFRRLPVTSGEALEGTISAKNYVAYFGSHEAFKRTTTGLIEEALSVPVAEVMEEKVVTINENADIGEAATLMLNNNVNYLIVINEKDEAVGIITERDVLMALAVD